MDKKTNRIRRARKTRARIAAKGVHRLSVFRTPRHIYAQIIAPGRDRTLVAASTLEKALLEQLTNGGNVAAAQLIGRTIAERAKSAGIETVAFDRAGFQYHGRIQALAEAAREAGLQF